MKTINSKKELINLLRRIHEQDETAPAPAPAPAPAAAPAAPAPGQPAAPAENAEPITLDDIIEKLNIIRSGRSTKDDDVKSELENYILQFSEEDKASLLAFLDGLGRILTIDEQNAQQATTPGAPPPASAPAPPPPKQSSIQSQPKTAAPQKSSAVPINVGGI
jgi:pyruvate dehydrogenase E2 component (dihydrolipoamide acetyltransferase)